MNIPDMSNSKSKLIEDKINQAINIKSKIIILRDVELSFQQHSDRPIMDQLDAKGYKWRNAKIQTGKRGNYRQLEITWN